MGRSCKHCHDPREPPDHSQQDPNPISTNFWEGKEICPNFDAKFGEMCIVTYKDYTHWAKLANHGLLVFGLAMLKTTLWVHTVFSTKNKKKYFDPGCDFPTKVPW